ncbi:MAG: hypothetical protein LBO74_07550 [Candidatus Symbiothrix sp.]|jgi:hypothetical protein|nr:hypothetical protein [Candidatus Symbiothrix sp.]
MNEEGLKHVYKSLLWWTYALATIYLLIIFSIYFKHALELSEILNPTSSKNIIYLGVFNKHLFSPITVGIAAGSCFFLVSVMILISNISKNSQTFLQCQFIIFTASNITLVCTFIATTGSFLNSPFSGAITVYLANIITLYNNNNLKKVKSILIISAIFIFSITLLILPYIYSYWIDNTFFIFDWSTDNCIVTLRLVVSILILIISIISSHNTNKKLSEIDSE